MFVIRVNLMMMKFSQREREVRSPQRCTFNRRESTMLSGWLHDGKAGEFANFLFESCLSCMIKSSELSTRWIQMWMFIAWNNFGILVYFWVIFCVFRGWKIRVCFPIDVFATARSPYQNSISSLVSRSSCVVSEHTQHSELQKSLWAKGLNLYFFEKFFTLLSSR